MLILVRLQKSLSPLHKLLDALVINIDHDDVTSDTRDMGPHGWIWVVQWRVGEYNNKLRCFRLQAHASFLRATHGKRKSRLLWMKDARVAEGIGRPGRVKKIVAFNNTKWSLSIFLDFKGNFWNKSFVKSFVKSMYMYIVLDFPGFFGIYDRMYHYRIPFPPV